MIAASSPRPDPPTPGDRRARLAEPRVLVGLWLLVFASSSQVLIVAPILPRIGESLAIPEALRGTLITAYTVPQLAFALLAGPVSDRIGRRPVLLLGAGSMVVFLLLHALPRDYPWLLTVRALTGISGGLLTGAAVAFIGDCFPYHRRGRATGWVMSGFAFGQILAVPVGTLLASRHGFRAPFLLFALPLAASFLLVALGFPRPASAGAREALGIGGALRAYAAMLRRPASVAAALAMGLMFFAQAAFFAYLPAWLEQRHGATAADVAAILMLGGVASVVAGPVMGRLSDRVGRKPLILASCLGLACLVPASPWLVHEPWTATLVVVAVMVLVTMRVSPMQALLTALAPASTRGSLVSFTVAVGHLGTGLGAGLAGPLFADHGFGANTLATAVAMTLAALVVGLAIPEPSHGHDDPSE